MRHKWLILSDIIINNNYKSVIDIGISKGVTVKGISHQMFTRAHALDVYYGVDPMEESYFAASREEIEDLCDWAPFKFVKKYSDDALKDFEQVDFVYVDGSHVPAQMCKDMENYVHKVKDGGCIAGHEYGATFISHINGDYKEITKFIDKFFGKENINTEEDARKESQDTVSVWWTYVYRNGDRLEYSKQRRTDKI